MPVTFTLGDGTTVSGSSLSEIEEKLEAIRNQEERAKEISTQIIDAARLRRLPRFDKNGNRLK